MMVVIKQLFGAFALCGLTTAAVVKQVPLVPQTVAEIPLLGFGTWNLAKDNASDVVSVALQTGYRHIDCAAAYGNQVEVGKGLKEGTEKAGLRREDIWVTSKLWNDHHRPDLVPQGLEETLKQLDLDYLDLYLMHWPVAQTEGKNSIDFVNTWAAMTLLLASGKVKHIGICNFSPTQLDELLESAAGIVSPPYAHQMELHPYLPQWDFLDSHEKQGIRITAYSPLGNSNPTYSLARKESVREEVPSLLQNPVVKEIAEKRGCTPAQVAIKWGLMRRTSVIPKSSHASRIVEDFNSTKCDLHQKDLAALRKELPVKRFNNPSSDWGVKLFDGLQDATVGIGKVVEDMEKMSSKAATFFLGLKNRLLD